MASRSNVSVPGMPPQKQATFGKPAPIVPLTKGSSSIAPIVGGSMISKYV